MSRVILIIIKVFFVSLCLFLFIFVASYFFKDRIPYHNDNCIGDIKYMCLNIPLNDNNKIIWGDFLKFIEVSHPLSMIYYKIYKDNVYIIDGWGNICFINDELLKDKVIFVSPGEDGIYSDRYNLINNTKLYYDNIINFKNLNKLPDYISDDILCIVTKSEKNNKFNCYTDYGHYMKTKLIFSKDREPPLEDVELLGHKIIVK